MLRLGGHATDNCKPRSAGSAPDAELAGCDDDCICTCRAVTTRSLRACYFPSLGSGFPNGPGANTVTRGMGPGKCQCPGSQSPVPARKPNAYAEKDSWSQRPGQATAREAEVGEGRAWGVCWLDAQGGAPLAGKPEAQPHHRTDSLDSSSGTATTAPAGFWCVTRGDVSSSDLLLGTASTFTSCSSCSAPVFMAF